MKKLFSVIAILGFAGVAQAAGKGVGPAGCGLGNMLFGKDTQILAATTNGTSASQMFGITSGTSGCEDKKGMAKLDSFVEANKVALSNDVARGNGETVASVSRILGCQSAEAVSSTLKQNYQVIFPSADSSSADVSQSIREVLKSNNVTCNSLS